MSSMMSKDKEIEQLRKKLLHARNIISELQDELKDQENVRYKLTTVCIKLIYLIYFIGAR